MQVTSESLINEFSEGVKSGEIVSYAIVAVTKDHKIWTGMETGPDPIKLIGGVASLQHDLMGLRQTLLTT